MRRSRAVDWWLLATLLPAYVLLQGFAIREVRANPRWYHFSLSGAQGASGYPIVDMLNFAGSPLHLGDRVLSVGGRDLRGLSAMEVRRARAAALRGDRAVRIEAERNGEPLQVEVEPSRISWWASFAGFAGPVVATFLLLRAPFWHLSRRFFACMLLWCLFYAADELSYSFVEAGVLTVVATGPPAAALLVWSAFDWTEAARPLRAWQRLLPWLVALLYAGSLVVWYLLTLPIGLIAVRVVKTIEALIVAFALVGLTRAYWRSGPLERRQLRWVLLGFYIALLPLLLLNLSQLMGIEVEYLVLLPVARAFGIAIPLGIAISVVGYHWLDIDRVISASAAATLVGIALLGGIFTVVPPVANAASASLGIDPENGRLALSMVLAAVLVPAYRALRPWLDRRMFAERAELTQRFERLRSELAACRGAEELTRQAGEGIDALLRPESIATYARAGESFTPVFVRGRAAPPAFEVKNTLVQVLEAKGAPLFARAKELGPFERAALETLGAEVVVPQLREQQLVAFTCLAAKRSGDIYTASDLALLRSVAERCGEVIARLDLETLAKEAQVMQLALRRYVPGAVAERVLAGDSMKPAEREVTVLFVDIRGYTGMAERLAAEDVFATLNEHTERVSRIVQEEGGTVVEFNGDGLMAVFGAPEALAKKEQQAVEAARRIVDSMPGTLAVGVGVATGEAFVGSIRSTDRLIWSAVGSTTNLASRLQSLTRELGASIAIDETTRDRAGDVCTDFARHEGVAIRGRLGRFNVFSLPLHLPRRLSCPMRRSCPRRRGTPSGRYVIPFGDPGAYSDDRRGSEIAWTGSLAGPPELTGEKIAGPNRSHFLSALLGESSWRYRGKRRAYEWAIPLIGNQQRSQRWRDLMRQTAGPTYVNFNLWRT